MVAVILALATAVIGAPALAASVAVHEITAKWAGDPVPTSAPYGQPVTAEWRVNTNDATDPFANDPVDNVRVTLVAGNGVFTSIPAICKTRDVTPASSISADGSTLVCNLGTVKEGTSSVIQAPLRANSTTGGNLSVAGTATSDAAAKTAGPADPGPLPITYTHGMDLSLAQAPGGQLQGITHTSRLGGSRPFILMNYSLILAAGSRPGPATYSFPVNISSNVAGSMTGLVAEGCVPVGGGSVSTGQPFSDPAQSNRTNFPTCSVSGAGTSYTVQLSNLDYTLAHVPTTDSMGQPLAGSGVYIASGTVQFSLPAPPASSTTYAFSASPGPFLFQDGASAPDSNSGNNTSSATLTPYGDFSDTWYGTPTASRSFWDANLWVSPGTSASTPLPVPGINTQEDLDAAIAQNQATGTPNLDMPLYMQANDTMWATYQGPGGAQMAGVCTMSQNPAFVIDSFEGGGAWPGTGVKQYQTARFFYTTQTLDTKTETCGESAPSSKWIEVTPPSGSSLSDPRIASDILMHVPGGVTAVKMTWNPAVDVAPSTFLRAFGHIDPAAPTSGEGWTVGAFNSPHDPATTWPGYPSLNGWVNVSTRTGGTDIPGSTYGPNANGIRDAFRLQGPTGVIEKTASDTSAQPGVPVTYTLRAEAQNAVTNPPSATFAVVDTLPDGMVYVPGTAQPAPASVSADGRTLTWNFAGVAPNVYQTIRYQAQRPVDSAIAPGTQLTNWATINVAGDNRPAGTPGRVASATVTVPSASATVFGKSAEANVLSFAGDSSAWALTINSQDPVASTFTDTIDILPAVGDGRGTDIDGTYTVTGVTAPAGSTVYYSTAPLASLSFDPRASSNGGTPGSVTGNTVGWTTTKPAKPTAVRVIGPSLAPGATQKIRIAYTTPAGADCQSPATGDNKPGQLLVNSAGSWAQHTALPMLSSATATIANCYAVNLKKYVQDADGNWHDANTPADYPAFRAGDQVKYRIVVENIGQGTITGLKITDDLFPEGSFTVDSLARGQKQTHEYTVTENGGGAVVNTACGTADKPADADAPTIFCDPAGVQVTNYTTAKSSNPASGATVHPGDRITYTVTVSQKGDSPANATFTDSLAKVLDDAVYQGDVTASVGTATVTGDTLSWAGIVPVGQTATITYSVIVKDRAALAAGGDYSIGNQVTSPGCVDAASCATQHEVSTYRVKKTSDPASGANVQPGDTIDYTITVTQQGKAPYQGASITDDLTQLLDDATWNGNLKASAGTVAYDAASKRISWNGDLAVGATVTITYSVTVTGIGDTHLLNVVTSDGCYTATDCTTEQWTATYTTVKTSDPASGADVQVGDTITYTVTVTQAGQGHVVAQFFRDDLAAVMDDATFDPATLTASAGTATYDPTAQRINWTGDLGPGAVATVTYKVVVTGKGDTKIGNQVTSPGCSTTADCATVHQTGRYVVEKTADPASGSSVQRGDTVKYTVTVHQVGLGPVNAASFRDDLTAVLDDATWNNDLRSTDGGATYAAPVVDWAGRLAVGDTVTVTYSVTVTGKGDTRLTNVVTSAGCADAASCTTEHLTGDYAVSKTSAPGSGADVKIGDTIVYTVTVTQRGLGAITGASAKDDLSAVLDDATWNNDATASSGIVSRSGNTLTWAGDLAVGQVVTITYSVTVTGAGDMTLTNKVVPGDERGECVPAPDQNPDCATTHKTGNFTYSKMSDPKSPATVAVGDTITYTVTVIQKGPAAVPGATLVDNLAGVLDDATFVDGSETATAGTVTRAGDTVNWVGDLAIGQVVTITYRVTVKGGGDTTLRNTVAPPQGSHLGECVAAPDGTPACETTQKYGGYVYSKTAEAKPGSTVKVGDTIRYTLTVTQTGTAPVTGHLNDDLSKVLDDASWNDDAKATAGTVTRTGDRLTWEGRLAVGQTVTIGYSVTVVGGGDRKIANVVTSPDTTASCVPAADDNIDCATAHTLTDPPAQITPGGLAFTGSTIGWGLVGTALALVVVGGALTLVRRRRHTEE
ncbi:DUF7927 domain-containing protein [Leifsonia sp. 21MFCrub1.1]|uniref:DUF7927 domain-containing protein n=1 Tax=Leifsonia sp. 21MFCrub1.1 TaxID=1798223 RepID=UPI0008927D42|nr:DUF11 domain-containing protein [Leifsonia sp. 21MFCrub1.1]SEB07579.1 conserved repeat domain-containing protein [Leifsonia sp. 21MFCrub1.1]